jgi:BlaI family transcriptional regulator, penicillinase repressor
MKFKPTDAELEVMQVLWEKGPSTVRTVHEELTKNRPVVYTTTLKVLQNMTEKGLVIRSTGQCLTFTNVRLPSQMFRMIS